MKKLFVFLMLLTSPSYAANPAALGWCVTNASPSVSGDTTTGVCTEGSGEIDTQVSGVIISKVTSSGLTVSSGGLFDNTSAFVQGNSSALTLLGGTVSAQFYGTGGEGLAVARTGSVNGVGITTLTLPNATIGAHTAVASGNGMGHYDFDGDDGANFGANPPAARIGGIVSGPVSANVIPGTLFISTTTTGGSLTQAMQIDNTQKVEIGTTTSSSNALLTVNGIVSGSNFIGPSTGSETASSSATPTFSVAFGTSYNVLTANVTSFTLSAGLDGQFKTLCFKQGSGPYTVSAPANVHGFFVVGITNADYNCQSFVYNLTNSIWLATSPGVINQ